jgi:hypothetical protein
MLHGGAIESTKNVTIAELRLTSELGELSNAWQECQLLDCEVRPSKLYSYLGKNANSLECPYKILCKSGECL